MKKILVRGPVLSRSGYGEQTRFALRSLRAHEDRFDIYIVPTGWGQTSWISTDDKERQWMDSVIEKTAMYMSQGGQFDMSLQVTIPNEWEKIAPINIGYTAGIETNMVAPVWIEKGQLMDKIILVSNHAKQVYETTTYEARNDQTGEHIKDYRCQTPMEVVNYPVRDIEPQPLDLKLGPDFNFLVVAQWGPRKNIENTVKWFVEEFIDQEVGLVVKTFTANNSIMDRYHTKGNIDRILSAYPNRKCKIYVLHGDMKDGELASLYTHPKIKSLITLAHGEGFGLPIFEAAYNGLPVIAPAWSGQCDFLFAPVKEKKKKVMKALFGKVEYTIAPIDESVVWENVLIKDSMWCYPDQGSYKMRLRDVYKDYDKYLKMAKKLKNFIVSNFRKEDKYKQFADAVYEEEQFEVSEWLDNLNTQMHE